jgi:mycoredoxin
MFALPDTSPFPGTLTGRGAVVVGVEEDETMIKVYGTTWCGDCHRARHVLDGLSEPYQWIDVDQDAPGKAHLVQVVGKVKVPLVEFPDGSHLVEPSNAALTDKVKTMVRT